MDFDLSLGVASSFTVHAYSFGVCVNVHVQCTVGSHLVTVRVTLYVIMTHCSLIILLKSQYCYHGAYTVAESQSDEACWYSVMKQTGI